MIRIPGERPHVPHISGETGSANKTGKNQPNASAKGESISRGPSMDSHALAVRMSVLAKEADDKDLNFEKIIQKVIDETGLINAQAAFEEVNRKLQKEIESELDRIKSDKELLEEAESWQNFADLLESGLTPEQIEIFMHMLQFEVKNLGV